jgi:hypothetical protein
MDSNAEDVYCWRPLQVVRGSSKTLRIIPGVLQYLAVVRGAQEAPNNPRGVIMVNIQVDLSSAATDGTLSALSLKELVVFARTQAVRLLDPRLMSRLRAAL